MKKLKLKLRRETILNLSDLQAVRGGSVQESQFLCSNGGTCGCPTLIQTECLHLCERTVYRPCN
jgi:hypothetical protein